MSTVKPRLTLRPGGNPANAPIVGLETYDPEAVIELLRQLREEGDAEEQRETLEFLKQAFNEGRPKGFGVFPEE
jgi:hypothetical protein